MKKCCTKCAVMKDFSEFGKDNNFKSGLSARCKECQSISCRENRSNISFKKREIAANRRRNREKRNIRTDASIHECPSCRCPIDVIIERVPTQVHTCCQFCVCKKRLSKNGSLDIRKNRKRQS